MPVKRRNTLRRRNSKKRNPSKKKPLRKRSTKKNSLKRKKNLSGGGHPAIYSVPTPAYPDYVPEYINYGTPAPLPPPPNTEYDFPAPPTFKQEIDKLSGAASALTVEDVKYGPQLSYGPREEAIAKTYAGEGQPPPPPPPPPLKSDDSASPPPSPPEVPKETYDANGNLVRYPGEDFFHYLYRVTFDNAFRSGKKCPELTDDMDPSERSDAEYCHTKYAMNEESKRENRHL